MEYEINEQGNTIVYMPIPTFEEKAKSKIVQIFSVEVPEPWITWFMFLGGFVALPIFMHLQVVALTNINGWFVF